MFVHCNQVKHSSYGHKFWDDCGAWTESRGRKIAVDPATLSEVRQLPDGLYGMRKRVDDKRVVVPLDPQPSQVYEVHQLCNRLKRDNTFQRRVTYLSTSDCYVAEYLGTFPVAVESHCNSVYSTGEYVRSTPEVMGSIKDEVKASCAKPSKIYQTLKRKADNDQNCPRNKKQVILRQQPRLCVSYGRRM